MGREQRHNSRNDTSDPRIEGAGTVISRGFVGMTPGLPSLLTLAIQAVLTFGTFPMPIYMWFGMFSVVTSTGVTLLLTATANVALWFRDMPLYWPLWNFYNSVFISIRRLNTTIKMHSNATRKHCSRIWNICIILLNIYIY